MSLNSKINNNLKYKWYVFIICLCLSTFIWLVIKFSKEYDVLIETRLSYYGLPKGYYIEKADSVLFFKMRANGFSLLSRQISSLQRINVDLSKYSLSRRRDGRYDILINFNKELEKKIYANYYYAKSFSEVAPSTINVVFSHAFTKKVPVKLDLEYNLENQHYLYGDIYIKPDSIILYGSKNSLDDIHEVFTEKLFLENLSKTKNELVKLRHINNNLFHLSEKQIMLHIPVEKFTEKQINLPIVHNRKDKIKLFPDKAQVVFLVAQKDFHLVVEDMFELSIDTIFADSDKHFRLLINKSPENLIIQRIIPETVEFINLE